MSNAVTWNINPMHLVVMGMDENFHRLVSEKYQHVNMISVFDHDGSKAEEFKEYKDMGVDFYTGPSAITDFGYECKKNIQGFTKHGCFLKTDIEVSVGRVVENPYFYRSAAETLRYWQKETERNFGNSVADNRIGLEHMAKNLGSSGFAFMKWQKNKWSDFKGIAIGSGPSLDYHYSELKRLRETRILVCADSALTKLLKNGVIPHAVVAMERNENLHLLWSGMTEEERGICQNVLLVASSLVHPNTIKKYPGPSVAVPNSDGLHAWTTDAFSLLFDNGNSAGNMAFQLLVHLGVSQIDCYGLDFAYGEDGQHHFSDCSSDLVLQKHIEKNPGFKISETTIDGWGGKILRTNPYLLSFRDTISIHVKLYGKPVFFRSVPEFTGAMVSGAKLLRFRIYTDPPLPRKIDLINDEEFEFFPGEYERKKKEFIGSCRIVKDIFQELILQLFQFNSANGIRILAGNIRYISELYSSELALIHGLDPTYLTRHMIWEEDIDYNPSDQFTQIIRARVAGYLISVTKIASHFIKTFGDKHHENN